MLCIEDGGLKENGWKVIIGWKDYPVLLLSSWVAVRDEIKGIEKE